MRNFMKLQALVLVLSLIISTGAQACYSAKEAEAEQGIRIHSELMVIGLSCMKTPGGQALYDKYERFTQKNASLLAGYEHDLISYYGKEGVADPEKKFNTLRTDMANEISRKAITMNTASFCQKYAANLDQAIAMDESTVRRWAQHNWQSQPASERMCASY
jgi:hypothetical protein